MSNTNQEKIKVFISNHKAYVWTGNEVCRLREQHRIVGNLVGCLPRLPRQNLQLGLPLQLLPEEVTLLHEQGVIEILDNSSPPEPGSESEVEEHLKQREQLYLQQIPLAQESAKKDQLRSLSTIVQGQIAKKRKLLKEGESLDEGEIEERVIEEIETRVYPPLPQASSCVQICTGCTREKTYKPGIWSFPSSPEDRLRYRVFSDLWHKDLWLTSGRKFGGDFLVYPGDPSRYHSFYIAVCLPYHKKMSALDVMALSRLGTNVKKTMVLCSLDDNDKIVYTSLQWTGIT